MRERLEWVAGLALAGMLLVACSSDDEPGTLPDVTPSESGTSLEPPSPTASLDPTSQLEAEITEFFESYIRASNQSWTSAEALELRRTMFADTCQACMTGYQLAERAQEEDLKFEGELGSVERVRLDSFEQGVVRFSGFTTTPASRLVDANGAVVVEFPPTNNLQVIYQAQRQPSGQWILINSEVLG